MVLINAFAKVLTVAITVNLTVLKREVSKLLSTVAWLSMVARLSMVAWLSILSACATAPGPGVVAVGDRSGAINFGTTAPQNTGSANAPVMPSAASEMLNRAQDAIESGQYAEAESWLHKAQRIVPRHPEVYWHWGQLNDAQAKQTQAKNMYRRCLSLAEKGSRLARLAQARLDAM